MNQWQHLHTLSHWLRRYREAGRGWLQVGRVWQLNYVVGWEHAFLCERARSPKRIGRRRVLGCDRPSEIKGLAKNTGKTHEIQDHGHHYDKSSAPARLELGTICLVIFLPA